MLRSLTSTRTFGNRARLDATRSAVPSVLPSSTTRISCAMASGSSARVTFSSVWRMFSLSQYAGMTIDRDRDALNVGIVSRRMHRIESDLGVLIEEGECRRIGSRPVVLHGKRAVIVLHVVDFVRRQRRHEQPI